MQTPGVKEFRGPGVNDIESEIHLKEQKRSRDTVLDE
jgi:hypothetical protein